MSTFMRFQEQVSLNRDAPDDPEVAASLALAVGILIGGSYPGCAAAVAVAYEKMFPEHGPLPICPPRA